MYDLFKYLITVYNFSLTTVNFVSQIDFISNAGLALLHISWLTTIYKRIFSHESKLLIKWAILTYLTSTSQDSEGIEEIHMAKNFMSKVREVTFTIIEIANYCNHDISFTLQLKCILYLLLYI